jgi:hypothetical protein
MVFFQFNIVVYLRFPSVILSCYEILGIGIFRMDNPIPSSDEEATMTLPDSFGFCYSPASLYVTPG